MKTENFIPNTPFRFAIWCSRENKWWAIGAISVVVISAILTRIGVYLVKILTDAAQAALTEPEAVSEFGFWAFAFAGFYLFNEWFWRISGFCGMRWITRTAAVANRDLFSYLTGHSAAYFSQRFAGALSNKISNAAGGLQNLLPQCLWNFLPITIGLLGDLYLTYNTNPLLAAVLGSWVVIFGVVTFLLVRRIHWYALKHSEAGSELRGKIVDSTTNMDTVQQMGHVRFEQEYVGTYIWKEQSAHLRRWWVSEWVLVTNALLLALFMAAMFGVVYHLVGMRMLSVGSVAMIVTIVIGLERSLFFLGHMIVQAVTQYGQIQEGLSEVLQPHSIVESPNASNKTIQSGKVSFKNVNFGYHESGVFKNFSLEIKSGEKIGLVGPSGAGKSTLVKLLLRQYDVESGEILIDGNDIRTMTLQSIREAIAIVPQSAMLFHRTIRDNISYGRLTATNEEIENAAKLAEAHEFILELPQGYDTLVGERGIHLSGGQRQRVAIARAIIRNSPILILDEATSSLDSESEMYIQKALENLMIGRTVIAIAHRLSTLRSMDRLIVVNRGEIVEEGNHERLLQNSGLYSRLWGSQVSGFIDT
ncbi:MAG: ABC transporter ATP-binding protein [Bdellovibrionales bacterium]|nr:ABC transporter ATP-binding protein [Bdellovibrionales bacterium]